MPTLSSDRCFPFLLTAAGHKSAGKGRNKFLPTYLLETNQTKTKRRRIMKWNELEYSATYSHDSLNHFPRLDCSCPVRPVGVAAPLHLALPAPFAFFAPDRLDPQVSFSQSQTWWAGLHCYYRQPKRVFAPTCHYCTYDSARQWIAAAGARQPGRLCRDKGASWLARTLRRWHATTRPRRISWTKWCPERRRARAARGAGAAVAASSSLDYSSCRCVCTPWHLSSTWTSALRSGGRSSSRSGTPCWHWWGLTRLTRRWRPAAHGRRLTLAGAFKLLR